MNTTNGWLAKLRALMAEAPEDAMVHKLAREYVEGHLEQSTSEYEPYSPRTPFATYSWEERFAIDGFGCFSHKSAQFGQPCVGGVHA
ncbi:MAG: hypothetical protein AAFX99_28140, partial [Myxococcota bacterium]